MFSVNDITLYIYLAIHIYNMTHSSSFKLLLHQKWRDRYFILRANKTLECYKSRKAADSMKSPRRVIDLRECINLEVGLEYKNLSHIMSLGTFKRTFFMAAPSDALMLQWGNVLEQTKSARDGEGVRV